MFRTFFLLLSIVSILQGCSTYKCFNSIERQVAANDKVKYKLEKLNVSVIGNISDNDRKNINWYLDQNKFQSVARAYYPNLFSDDESSLPVTLEVKYSLDGFKMLIPWIVSFFTIPSVESHTLNYDVKIIVGNEEKIEFNQSGNLMTKEFMTIFGPLGWIPLVGDYKLGSLPFTYAGGFREAIINQVVKSINDADQVKIARVQKLHLSSISKNKIIGVNNSSHDVSDKTSIRRLGVDEIPGPAISLNWPSVDVINANAVGVIIGNRHYETNSPDVPNVNYAHNDAMMMRWYLTEKLGYREGNIIFLKDATQAQMVATFGNDKTPKGTLYGWVRPGESDVFVYYSGHGAPSLQSGKGYLLPVDANPTAVELNGYPLDLLYQNLNKIPARSMTVVIDACFSGASEGGAVVKNASSIALRRVEAESQLSKGSVFTAAGLSEVASWDKESRLGLFTRYFLEGVSGNADKDGFGNNDGQVTSAEMQKYLEIEVSYMARRLYMREQHPQYVGDGAMVLSTLR